MASAFTREMPGGQSMTTQAHSPAAALAWRTNAPASALCHPWVRVRPEVQVGQPSALRWGSASSSSTRPVSARADAKLVAKVVFPTPPFWLTMATAGMGAPLLLYHITRIPMHHATRAPVHSTG